MSSEVLHFVATSEATYMRTVLCARKKIGLKLKFISSLSVERNLTEDQVIFSRAVAKFQHLIIMEE